MSALAIIVPALGFCLLEAAYFWHRAALDRRRAAIYGRLGIVEAAAPLLRLRHTWAASLPEWLDEAGLSWSPLGFVGRTVSLALLLGGVGMVLLGATSALCLGLLGGILPTLYVFRARRQRIEAATDQLPRALEVMMLALRAGYSLPQALELVADEIPPPLGSEIGRISGEHALGRPLEQAFSTLGRRLAGSEAVRTLVTGVLVLRQTGGNLIEVIERIIETIQAQEHYRMRLKSLTAESRSSGTLLSVLPLAFALLAALADSGYMGLFASDGVGRMLAGVAIFLWVTGVVWMRRMVRPEA